MFNSFSGFKSQCEGLTLLVVSEFNEWKILAYAPGITIHGTRQFTEAKAKDHAAALAASYLREQLNSEAPPPQLEWQPTSKQDWLVWRG